MTSIFHHSLHAVALVVMWCVLPADAVAQIFPLRPPENYIRGVLITSVLPNTTAAKAGMQPGQIVTRVNNERVISLGDFVEKLGASRGVARLTLFDRSTKQFRTVDVQPDRQGLIGVFAIATDHLIAYRSSVLLVNGVSPGSPAAAAGLMPGDVILAVNGVRVPTTADFVNQFLLSGPIATVTFVSGFDGRLRVAAVLADPFGRIGAFFVPVPWR